MSVTSLLTNLANSGLEVKIDGNGFYVTDNKDFGLATYKDVDNNDCYYYFTRKGVKPPQEFNDAISVLESSGLSGGKHKTLSFTIKKIKLLPTILNDYQQLLKKHKNKPLLAFTELVDQLGENERNIEQVLTGLEEKNLMHINTQYKILKKHSLIPFQLVYEQLKSQSNPIEAVINISQSVREKEGNITQLINGLGYRLGPLDIFTKIYKDQSFQGIRNKLNNKIKITKSDITNFLINLGDSDSSIIRKLFRRLESGIPSALIKKSVEEATKHFEDITASTYLTQKNNIKTMLENGVNERELEDQLNLPYYVSKRVCEQTLISEFPNAKSLKELKDKAKDKGYKLNHWTYYRAFNEKV